MRTQNNLHDRISEVKKHYIENDFDLAGRRLIDCALDTSNIEIYRNTLNLIEWEENKKNRNRDDELKTKAFDLLNQMIVHHDQNKVTQGRLIDAKNINKKYSGSPFELYPLSLTLDTGEIIGLVGENGNGKTTLLKIIAGHINKDGGELRYYIDQKEKDRYDLRTRLIYIDQRIPKWYGSVMDNLQFTLASYGVKGERNLLLSELMVARLGMRPYRSMTWGRISSGYRTRFELARQLLRKPRILLLDEPLANLDIISQQTILQDLKFMAGSSTSSFGIILSSQHIYEVEKISDKVIFLKNGKAQYHDTSTNPGGSDNKKIKIFEVETKTDKETLYNIFSRLSLKQLQFNGGVYTLYFEDTIDDYEIFRLIVEHRLDITYIRNISNSARRFFNN